VVIGKANLKKDNFLASLRRKIEKRHLKTLLRTSNKASFVKMNIFKS
jgi:hypothetical protein